MLLDYSFGWFVVVVVCFFLIWFGMGVLVFVCFLNFSHAGRKYFLLVKKIKCQLRLNKNDGLYFQGF